MKSYEGKTPMKNSHRHLHRLLFGVTACAVVLFFSACDSKNGKTRAEREQDARRSLRAENRLRLVYPEWSTEIASAHLFQAVLQERMGYRVQVDPVSVDKMWKQVATGEADILTGAWLPLTHRDYYTEYRDAVQDLGANLTGARIGLVVPTVKPGRQTGDTGRTGRKLVTIHSIAQLKQTKDRFNGRIIGIESGAGVMARTREALKAYDLERHFRLVATNEKRMIERVSAAVNRGEWIVFTGWKPHRIFELYNLRFLDDPKDVFGGEESIHTMVRSGLQEDMPDAYTVLARISYKPAQIERLMRWIHTNGKAEAYEQAVRWINANTDMVDDWVKGVE